MRDGCASFGVDALLGCFVARGRRQWTGDAGAGNCLLRGISSRGAWFLMVFFCIDL